MNIKPKLLNPQIKNVAFHVWIKSGQHLQNHEQITNEVLDCKDEIITCKHEIFDCKNKILNCRNQSKIKLDYLLIIRER